MEKKQKEIRTNELIKTRQEKQKETKQKETRKNKEPL